MVFIFNIIILSMYVLQYILQKSASELPPDTWTYLFEIAYKGQKLSKANLKRVKTLDKSLSNHLLYSNFGLQMDQI